MFSSAEGRQIHTTTDTALPSIDEGSLTENPLPHMANSVLYSPRGNEWGRSIDTSCSLESRSSAIPATMASRARTIQTERDAGVTRHDPLRRKHNSHCTYTVHTCFAGGSVGEVAAYLSCVPTGYLHAMFCAGIFPSFHLYFSHVPRSHGETVGSTSPFPHPSVRRRASVV